jgi:hypothetical protein
MTGSTRVVSWPVLLLVLAGVAVLFLVPPLYHEWHHIPVNPWVTSTNVQRLEALRGGRYVRLSDVEAILGPRRRVPWLRGEYINPRNESDLSCCDRWYIWLGPEVHVLVAQPDGKSDTGVWVSGVRR